MVLSRMVGRRRGFTLIELLVVVVIIGILASVALPSLVSAQDRARNASVQANLNTVVVALETYMADFKGSSPGNTLWASSGTDGFQQGNYLPGNKLPKSPWCKASQTVRIQPVCPPQIYAEDYTDNHMMPPQPGTRFTPPLPGAVAGAPTLTEHYGAITSDCDSNGSTTNYVLQATGKRGKEAITVGSKTN